MQNKRGAQKLKAAIPDPHAKGGAKSPPTNLPPVEQLAVSHAATDINHIAGGGGREKGFNKCSSWEF